MGSSDFFDALGGKARPEPNIKGNFDCFECREPVEDAYYDATAGTVRWWCSQGHSSKMEEVQF